MKCSWDLVSVKWFDRGVPIIFPNQHCALRLKKIDDHWGYWLWLVKVMALDR